MDRRAKAVDPHTNREFQSKLVSMINYLPICSKSAARFLLEIVIANPEPAASALPQLSFINVNACFSRESAGVNNSTIIPARYHLSMAI
jgi:hypothetical protein